MTQLSPKQFLDALKEDDALLLDVRTDEELEEFGVIQENQVHINMAARGARENLLTLPKDKHLLVYCWHGNRSQMVVQFLEQEGYTRVHDLAGGIDALM